MNEYFKTNYKILLNKFFVILKLDATFNHKFASTKNNHNLSNHTTMSSLRHYLLIFYFLILTTTIAISQNSQEDQNDDPTPGWVYMMGDMDANFYDVQKIATE